MNECERVISGGYRRLKPNEAVHLRDDIASGLVNPIIAPGTVQHLQKTTNKPMEECARFVVTLRELVKDASVIFWNTELWKAAIEGSEAFEHKKACEVELRPRWQLLVPDLDFISDEDTCEHFQLGQCKNMMAVLVGKFDDGMLMCVHFMQWLLRNEEDARKYRERVRENPDECGLRLIGYKIESENELKLDCICDLAALNEFMKLKIASVREVCTVSRPVRRVMQRMGERVPYVHIVSLRQVERKSKEVDHEHEKRSVDWQHSWIVSGHWRQQWYPSENTHHELYVQEYLKGPSEKPLLPPRGKLYKVVR